MYSCKKSEYTSRLRQAEAGLGEEVWKVEEMQERMNKKNWRRSISSWTADVGVCLAVDAAGRMAVTNER